VRGKRELKNYFESLAELQKFLVQNDDSILKSIDMIYSKIQDNRNIWIMGNGGSASTSDHFETDLHFIKRGKDLGFIGAQSLASNSSLLSAIGNDIGFEEIFRHQLMRKSKKQDLVFLISASGNSQNLINATLFAKNNSMSTIALLGFDGGKLLSLVDHAILVKSDIGMYGPIEDIHLSICHAISAKLDSRLR
jgi:D-sedoheptulose 7-phosphate isomerase